MALNVALLWHMHQPYYVNPLTKTALMPWVRLHAVKGYLDMVTMARRHPQVKMVFNLTPVLVKQILELIRGEVKDLWEEWSKVPASELSPQCKRDLLEHFFKANWDNLIRPNPRYHELLTRRGYDLSHLSLDAMVPSFSKQDYLDLQVWFNLAWCGYAAFQEYPILDELKKKGRHFTESEKLEVLSVHRKILQSILSRYKEVRDAGHVELSTTPFFHPISPLLLNTDFALRAMPMATLPPKFSWPEDFESHIRLAIEQHQEVFGTRPVGLWPSEGSVCPEMIPMLQQTGFRWFATDEDNLFRSLHRESSAPIERPQLYEPYEVEWEGAKVHAVFRDRSLSDFIGFSAARNAPQEAVSFIMHHVRGIATATESKDEPLVAIILDGENAWEYFSDGGQAFLDAWYRQLDAQQHWRMTLLEEYSNRQMFRRRLRQLHSGSWIQGNFDIWIGDPEENRAWQLLGETRLWWERRKNTVPPKIAQQVWMEIYSAEGSDWFWWYGPDFSTDNDLLFDELFRTHLQNVYRLCGATIPESLSTPICRPTVKSALTYPPIGLIHPKLDGLQTTFFEWHEAGRYEPGQTHSAMFQGERILKSIFYGFDRENFYLRLDGLPEVVKHTDLKVQVDVEKKASFDFRWSPATGTISSLPGVQAPTAHVVCKKIIEMSVPFESWGLKEGDEVHFRLLFSKTQNDQTHTDLEHHPENGWLEFKVPGPDFAAAHWSA